MRRFFIFTLTFILLIVIVEPAWGQSNSDSPFITQSPFIFRVEATKCLHELSLDSIRVQTGFMLKGEVGIVTALHGVVDCDDIDVIAEIPNGLAFSNLEIAKVNIDKDVAQLLPTNEKDKALLNLADGFELELDSSPNQYAGLHIIGHAFGARAQLTTEKIQVRQTSSDILIDLVPDSVAVTLTERGSPNPKFPVISIEGHSVSGLSGAPVLNAKGRLVAIGNGGLGEEYSWVIPWREFKWQSKDEAQLAQLRQHNPTGIFFSYSDSPTDSPQIDFYNGNVLKMTGEPIAGAQVLLDLTYTQYVVYTTSEGQFSFALEASLSQKQVNARVYVSAQGYNREDRLIGNPLAATKKAQTEVIRLTPSENGGGAKQKQLCEYAFRVLNENDDEPVEKAKISVTIGTNVDDGYTDSNGSYTSQLPCTDQNPKVKVRIRAENYESYSATIILNGEIEEIYLTPIIITPIPELPTSTPVPTTATVLPKSNTTSLPAEEVLVRLEYDGIDASNWWGVDGRPEFAFDRKTNKGWYVTGDMKWLNILFRKAQTVSKIRLYRNSPESYTQIKEVLLTFSDTSSQLVTFKGLNEWEEVAINPVVTEEIKLDILKTQPENGGATVVYEVEFLGPKDSFVAATPTQVVETLSTLRYDGLEASNWWGVSGKPEFAFDRKTSTGWYVNQPEKWVNLLFREPKTLSKIRLYRNPQEYYTQIKELLLTFPDGSSQLVMFDGLNEWEEIHIEPVITQEVKVEIVKTQPDTGGATVVYELELLGVD